MSDAVYTHLSRLAGGDDYELAVEQIRDLYAAARARIAIAFPFTDLPPLSPVSRPAAGETVRPGAHPGRTTTPRPDPPRSRPARPVELDGVRRPARLQARPNRIAPS